MNQKSIGLIILALLLMLSGCSKDKYEPFKPLSEVTVSPEREAAVQAALNGGAVLPTAAPTAVPDEEPVIVPSFDEDSFFAEVSTSNSEPIQTDVQPFDPDPDQSIPAADLEPTPTKEYDPNIMMYGKNEYGQTTYTLQDGEDLICLGRRFNISVSSLLSQNGLSEPGEAVTGSVIVLPTDADSWKMTDGYGRQMLVLHPATYTTESGDNLFTIACKYGNVKPEDIATKNRLVLGETLPAGLQISIP